MRLAVLAVVVILGGTLALPAVSAQERVIRIGAQMDNGLAMVSRGPGDPARPQTARFQFQFADISTESLTPATSAAELHQVSGSAIAAPGEDTTGWTINLPLLSTSTMRAGDTGTGDFEVQHDVGTPGSSLSGILILRLDGTYADENDTVEIPWRVIIAPSPGVQLSTVPGGTERVKPFQLATFQVQIRNVDTYRATFRIAATVLPGDGIDPTVVQVLGVGDQSLEGGASKVVTLTVLAPRDKFWYNDVPLMVRVEVTPTAGGSTVTTMYLMTVSGFYVSENIIILTLIALAQIALFIFLIIFGRRAYERRYLGRPIPPWQIPEEAAALERLKRDDPRAHYLLRYFIMEEEYRSALLWFYSYKKISKKRLKAEIKAIEMRERADELVSQPSARFDKASGRIQRRYARKMERAEARTQREIERLQAKLSRTYEKDYEKDHGKWEAKVEKLQKKHNKPYVKAKAKWDKETKRILEKWEKPFRKEKKKYDEALAAAKEKYAKKVKKADKPTWRAWREQMDDWESENKLRKKEGRELAPEPALFSAAVGPPDLPAPFQEPPRPELPPEPQPDKTVELPPEPQLTTPDVWSSHYAKKAKKAQRNGARQIRSLELELAEKLNKLRHEREDSGVKVEEKRERLIAASQTMTASRVGFVDRVLRRSATDVERRHHIAYLRGLTHERIKELEEAEAATLERVRVQGEREQADLEAKILGERSRQRSLAGSEKTAHAERIASLVRQLGELKNANQQKLRLAQRESKQRIQAGVTRLKAEEREAIDRELGRNAPTAPAEPAQS